MGSFPEKNPLRLPVRATLPKFAPEWPIRFCTSDEEAAPRKLLASLLTRRWHQPPRIAELNWEFGTEMSMEMVTSALAFKVRALAEARWLAMKSGDPHWKLRAQVSQGAHYFVQIWHFAKETPADVRFESTERITDHFSYVIDAGDVVVALSKNEPMLLDTVHSV